MSSNTSSLLLCHGRIHVRRLREGYLSKEEWDSAIYIDKDPRYEPDVIMDISKDQRESLGGRVFNKIYTVYHPQCILISDNRGINNEFWMNITSWLSPGGMIYSHIGIDYIIRHYSLKRDLPKLRSIDTNYKKELDMSIKVFLQKHNIEYSEDIKRELMMCMDKHLIRSRKGLLYVRSIPIKDIRNLALEVLQLSKARDELSISIINEADILYNKMIDEIVSLTGLIHVPSEFKDPYLGSKPYTLFFMKPSM